MCILDKASNEVTNDHEMGYFVTGQCYDGASAMKGKRNGLKTLILATNPKAIYIHCYAHSLQLAVNDSVKQLKPISEVLDLCCEVAKLVRKSPKRTAALKALKAEIQEPTVGIRSLCPTRWVEFTSTMTQ